MIKSDKGPRLISVLFGEYSILIVFFVICILLSFLTGGVFLHPENLKNVVRQISVQTIIAVGMTMVIITGGIDLSVGSLVALTGVLGAWVIALPSGLPVIIKIGLGILFALLIGGGCGAFSGFVITRFNIPPFIATLAIMTAARGFAYIFCGGRPVWNLPTQFSWLGRGYLFESLLGQVIPVPVIIMAGIVIAGYILMTQTRFGRYVYAVGGNKEAARLSGINVKKIIFSVHLLIGTLAGLAGIILASRLGAGDPKSGMMWELDVIAAVVVGGTSLAGGRGKITGTLIGALIIGVIRNGLNLLNVSSYWQQVVLGAVILIAVLIDQIKKKE